MSTIWPSSSSEPIEIISAFMEKLRPCAFVFVTVASAYFPQSSLDFATGQHVIWASVYQSFSLNDLTNREHMFDNRTIVLISEVNV